MCQMLLVSCFLFLIARSSLAINNRTFPDGFSFGTATASYQIEGAWNESDKGENIWDHVAHTDPNKILNKDSGDVACDSYHKYKEDVAMLVDLKVTHYRFSLSWSRILPSGFNNKINIPGVLYYQNLLKELENNNITPLVTLYHWDLPQPIQDVGGWTNKEIVNYFRDFAEIAFMYFPTVKYWITINEPKQVCLGGYGKAQKAPFYNNSGLDDYLCAYNLVRAHAAAYHLYQDNFKHLGGKLTMAMDGAWNYPKSQNKTDTDAAERRRLFEFGLYAHPIFWGDWPKIVADRVAARCKIEKYPGSRLPSFSDEDKKLLNHTADFMALNYYDTRIVENAPEPSNASFSYDNDVRVILSANPTWKVDIHGIAQDPNGFREFLKWVKKTYNNPEIMITENGMGDNGSKDDYARCGYIADFLSAVLDSIFEDKVNIKMYTFWSLLDNFEWTFGYNHHFGLYSVDFSNPNRPRTEKKSTQYYKKILTERKLSEPPQAGASKALTVNILLVTLAVAFSIY